MKNIHRLQLGLHILCMSISLTGFAQTLIPYRSGELWGYCTPDKKIVIPPQYERAGWFNDGLALVAKGCNADCYDRYDGKWGYIDVKGKEVIPLQYDEALRFIKGKTYARQGNSWFELNTKGVHVQKLNEAPDFTVKQYEVYLEEDIRKEYYPEYTDHKKGNVTLKGYMNKQGEQYWEDPEVVFFFPITNIAPVNESFTQVQVIIEHPLFAQLSSENTSARPTQLLLIRDESTKITVAKSFNLEPKIGDKFDQGIYYIEDFDSIKPYLNQTGPLSKNEKLVFACPIKVPYKNIRDNTLVDLIAYGIELKETKSGYNLLHFYTSMYELTKDYKQKLIINNMVNEIRQTAALWKTQESNRNINLQSTNNLFAGKMLLDVMERVTEDDVWQFLYYVQSHPFKYIAGNWKLAEIFAEWLTEGAPQGNKKVNTK